MFLSKIWFFLVAVAGGTALTVALLLPRPAERQRAAEERQRVTTACDVVNILLTTNARSRIDLAGKFARSEVDLASILGPATKGDTISDDTHKAARTAAATLLDSTTGAKPTFIFLVDGRGRAVARLGRDEKQYGDLVAGYHLVDDALDGYLRDDLWIIDKELYLVAGAPVIGTGYAGAVIIGHRMDKELAEEFVKQLGVDLNFYADSQLMAASNTVSVHKGVIEQYARLSTAESPPADDCHTFEPFDVDLGAEVYAAQIARLPGEAGKRGAFFSVFVQRPATLGMMATLSSAKQEDISFANFPWFTLGGGFVFAIAVGMLFMLFESDLPLRRLSAAAVKVAKGELERFDEDAHRGKFGSIARSVNIQLDKMEREAKAKKTDLDDLLGPPSASALPLAGPGPARSAKPPPPSEFKFTATPPPPAMPGSGGGRPPIAPPRAMTPPPTTPPQRVSLEPPPLAPAPAPAMDDAPVDDLELEEVDSADTPADEAAFRRVFQEFLQVKKQCGESTSNLTYDKFAGKLRNNRSALVAKHGCKEVKFQVYVKDGKAALKATPVKD